MATHGKAQNVATKWRQSGFVPTNPFVTEKRFATDSDARSVDARMLIPVSALWVSSGFDWLRFLAN
jgi:hypothetical protein